MVTQTIYGVRKRSFRPTPKAGEQPFAPTPLSHSVGEGLGVRAKEANASHAVNLSDVPLSDSNPPRTRGRRRRSSPVHGEG